MQWAFSVCVCVFTSMYIKFAYVSVCCMFPWWWYIALCRHSNTFHMLEMSHLMTKPTNWHVRPAKTQISLGIRPGWSESSLSAWRKLGYLDTGWVHSEDSDQTGRMLSLCWARSHFVSWGGSNVSCIYTLLWRFAIYLDTFYAAKDDSIKYFTLLFFRYECNFIVNQY